MSDINTSFTRAMLQSLQKDITRLKVKIDGKGLNLFAGHGAWVYDHGRQHWEFHGPNKFYWHGSAWNAYEARFKGWSAYIEKHMPEVHAQLEKLDLEDPEPSAETLAQAECISELPAEEL